MQRMDAPAGEHVSFPPFDLGAMLNGRARETGRRLKQCPTLNDQ
jgi:hypothetical protein